MAGAKKDKNSKTKSEPQKPRPNKEKAHQNELLDEALEETFPASDPPAITRPHRHPPKQEK